MNTQKNKNINSKLYMSCQPVPDSYKQAIFPKFLTQKKSQNLIDFLIYLRSCLLIEVLSSKGVLVFLVLFSFSGLFGFFLVSLFPGIYSQEGASYLLCRLIGLGNLFEHVWLSL